MGVGGRREGATQDETTEEMTDLWPVQQAVYSALSTAPTTYPVYDAVPQGAVYPYIAIGAFSVIPDREIGSPSSDAALTLHGWSKGAGKQQSHAILEFVRGRLDGVDIGGGAWACSEDSVEVFEDAKSTAASRLYHAVARYRIRAN